MMPSGRHSGLRHDVARTPPGQRRRRHPGYRFVHVRPDGSQHPAGETIGSWPAALSRVERMVAILQAELIRGNPDAGGEVWVINIANGVMIRKLLITLPQRDDG
jgi:hypothetical protein